MKLPPYPRPYKCFLQYSHSTFNSSIFHFYWASIFTHYWVKLLEQPQLCVMWPTSLFSPSLGWGLSRGRNSTLFHSIHSLPFIIHTLTAWQAHSRHLINIFKIKCLLLNTWYTLLWIYPGPQQMSYIAELLLKQILYGKNQIKLLKALP